MKKLLFVVIPILIIVAGLAFAMPKQNIQRGDVMNNKILIAYFSHSGNTKSIAQKIQAQTGGELFEIQSKEPYPKDYNKTTEIVKEQKSKNIMPELKENKDISNYDVIFVGTPAWWYTMAAPVKTFLSTNNFEGKTIVPFISHGGGGKYNIADEMGNLAKGSKVLKPFAVYGACDSNTEKELKSWLNELGF